MPNINNPKKSCFIITKFGDTISKNGVDYNEAEAFYKAIKTALEYTEVDESDFRKEYIVNRVHDDRATKGLRKQIYKNIISADLVICNLQPNKFSDDGNKFAYNANVIYETALRHALNFPIIHFLEDRYIKNNEIPFDLSDNFTIPYTIDSIGNVVFDIELLYTEINAVYLNDEVWPFSEILRQERTYCYYDFLTGKSNLINWKESQILEQEAEEVYSVTSNLNWTLSTYSGIISNIIRDKNKPVLNRHRYLFIRDESEKQGNEKKFRKIIESNRNALYTEYGIDLDKYIKVHSISQTDFNEKCKIKHTDSLPMLPKPVDLVLYLRTKDIIKKKGKRSYLVMSVNKVEENTTIDDYVKNYDVIFKDAEHINKALNWFKHLWVNLTGEDLELRK